MKVKIKEYFGELPECFNTNKKYVVSVADIPNGMWVFGDDGDEHYILLSNCSYLNGGSWEIVSE